LPAVAARRRDRGAKALVSKDLPAAVSAHTAMDKSRRNQAVGRSGVLQGGFSGALLRCFEAGHG
jgi:hypothetical protein